MAKRKKWCRFFLILAAVLALYLIQGQPLFAQPKFARVFTDLSEDCRGAFKKVAAGQDMPLKCKGSGQYYV
ncbi:MAG: hypothetical protein ACUVXF_09250 [Desulfobaccales bacterium]